MPVLNPGASRIISVKDGRAAGIEESSGSIQVVRLGLPVDKWEFNKYGDSFKFSLDGYPYTGFMGDMVFVSVGPVGERQWIITPINGAYLILLADNRSVGWTVSEESQIVIDKIAFPPRDDQLFRLERVD